MKYIVCQEPGKFLIKEKNEPLKKADHALLKIKKVGICGTDFHAFKGNQAYFEYPRILGHELSAEVLHIEKNEQGIAKGDAVIVMPYVSCQLCAACRAGKPNCCVNIKVLGVHIDGGMQEVISVPNSLLIKADGLSNNEIAIVEPLAIAAHALRRARVKPNDQILVIGCGPIGIGIQKLAQSMGAEVIAMDVSADRLEYAKYEMGINHIVHALHTPLEKVEKITGGNFAPLVFDASGNKEAIESGVNYMSHGGTYVIVGLSKGNLTFNHPAIHAKESTIMCSRNATMEDFSKVKEILQSRAFPTSSFVTHETHFSNMIDVFSDWLEPKTGVIKALVSFD
jgi:2-desacetyl-2-hydroxyethyl bacteriochlorophyllide A dehydrogenase